MSISDSNELRAATQTARAGLIGGSPLEKFYAGNFYTAGVVTSRPEVRITSQGEAVTYATEEENKSSGIVQPKEGEQYIEIKDKSGTTYRIPKSQWTPQMQESYSQTGKVYNQRQTGNATVTTTQEEKGFGEMKTAKKEDVVSVASALNYAVQTKQPLPTYATGAVFKKTTPTGAAYSFEPEEQTFIRQNAAAIQKGAHNPVFIAADYLINPSSFFGVVPALEYLGAPTIAIKQTLQGNATFSENLGNNIEVLNKNYADRREAAIALNMKDPALFRKETGSVILQQQAMIATFAAPEFLAAGKFLTAAAVARTVVGAAETGLGVTMLGEAHKKFEANDPTFASSAVFGALALTGGATNVVRGSSSLLKIRGNAIIEDAQFRNIDDNYLRKNNDATFKKFQSDVKIGSEIKAIGEYPDRLASKIFKPKVEYKTTEITGRLESTTQKEGSSALLPEFQSYKRGEMLKGETLGEGINAKWRATGESLRRFSDERGTSIKLEKPLISAEYEGLSHKKSLSYDEVAFLGGEMRRPFKFFNEIEGGRAKIETTPKLAEVNKALMGQGRLSPNEVFNDMLDKYPDKIVRTTAGTKSIGLTKIIGGADLGGSDVFQNLPKGGDLRATVVSRFVKQYQPKAAQWQPPADMAKLDAAKNARLFDDAVFRAGKIEHSLDAKTFNFEMENEAIKTVSSKGGHIQIMNTKPTVNLEYVTQYKTTKTFKTNPAIGKVSDAATVTGNLYKPVVGNIDLPSADSNIGIGNKAIYESKARTQPDTKVFTQPKARTQSAIETRLLSQPKMKEVLMPKIETRIQTKIQTRIETRIIEIPKPRVIITPIPAIINYPFSTGGMPFNSISKQSKIRKTLTKNGMKDYAPDIGSFSFGKFEKRTKAVLSRIRFTGLESRGIAL